MFAHMDNLIKRSELYMTIFMLKMLIFFLMEAANKICYVDHW